jgi:hypothetical protein
MPDCDNILYANSMCHAHYMKFRRWKTYDITPEKYIEMLTTQNGVCDICGEKEMVINGKSGKIRDLAIDHCHATGKVRALLCNPCNTAIGLLKDNPATLRKAADYLERHTSAPLKNNA